MFLPQSIIQIIDKIQKAGYEAFIVGGCVRDILRNKTPKDWDITTSAKPKEIQKLFPKSFYDNAFGTVGIPTKEKAKNLKVVEVTTFRTETKYTDKRHPDQVKFAKTLDEDLKRRDFTINAMAMRLKSPSKNLKAKVDKDEYWQLELIDPFGGKEDLKNEIIRTVGDPNERFSEDALRLMRAIRFATELNFTIDQNTLKAIQKNAESLRQIAHERIRDELIKIIMSDRAHFGIMYLHEAGLLQYIIPELEKGIGVTQNHHHPYDCYYHNVYSLEYAAAQNYALEIRLAVLLHDIGKPYVKEGLGSRSTFYNHAQFGARVTKTILERLKFPKKIVDKVAHLVEFHMFYYDADIVTDAGVRRLLRRLGKENIQDFMEVRMCDRIGSRAPKAKPYRLRHLEYMFEKVSSDPISVKMLKIDGNDIMKILKIQPSKRVGLLLEALLQEVLDDPKKNSKKYLKERVQELHRLSDKELEKKAAQVYKMKEEKEEERKRKYWVR